MSNRGKRKWAPESTLVTPDPEVKPIDLELIDTAESSDGIIFAVKTEKMSAHTFYQFNELLARLCDSEVILTQYGKVWSNICVLTSNEAQARRSMEDATRFFRLRKITWEQCPRE